MVPRAIEAINPSLYILMETELWPLMITRLKKRGVKLILANGRISDRSYGGYKKLSYIMGGVLSCFDFIGAISEKDRERFVRLGAPAERVFVMGNLKYDSVLEAVDPSIERKMRRLLNLRDEPLWVCGSTHEGEERIAVKVYLKLLKDFPDLRLALVPRHPERARSIADTLLSLGVRFSLRSENPQDKVVLWDLMGELFGLYSVATVVFCGGSLVPLGGHNVIEPASWGKPVIYGPYMDDFLEETRFLEEAGAGFSVADENELYEVVRRLLLDGKARERIQLSLKEYLSRSKGVLERYLSVIDDLLGGGVSN